jgi:Ca2+-binding EF-hand superfamily protein
MTTAISSLSSSTGATTFDPAKGAARFASKVFSDMDTDTDGKVSKDEFVKGLESKGVSTEDATKQYEAIDKEGTDRSPRTTWNRPSRAAISNRRVHKAAQAARKVAAQRGGAGQRVSGSSSTKTYEAADKNEDGTVTQQEQLVYDMAQATKTAAASTTSASSLGNNVNEARLKNGKTAASRCRYQNSRISRERSGRSG